MTWSSAFERDMSASVGEFAAGLRAACPGEVSGGPLEFRVASRGVVLEIRIEPTAPRRIASLVLPRLHAHYRFTAGGVEAQAALLAHLDRAMQRGGG